jgi:hypothetical protein
MPDPRGAPSARPSPAAGTPAPAAPESVAAPEAPAVRTRRRAAARPRRPRALDAIPDTLDFRDRMFVPTLVEVPAERPLADYRRYKVPVLDQQGEGACTGFGLATVANYLLRARDARPGDARPGGRRAAGARAGAARRGPPPAVSPRMLYEMAKRYDEWPGERYEGSSARGAIKGWHKHGVCCWDEWPYEFGAADRDLTAARAADATRRPLGAYFRVNHRDLVAMHAAVAEAGVLFATATVHEGWNEVGAGGAIEPRDELLGGHAFAVVGYDERGFWVQNSWGEHWGKGGFARVGYDDWLANGTDVWVARLGAPVVLGAARTAARALPAAAAGSRGYAFADLRPHVVSLGNDGQLRAGGTYGTSRRDVERLVRDDLARVTAGWDAGRPKRVLLYAHGGLVPEESALQRVAEYRAALLGAEVYPVGLVWKTDFWSTVSNVLRDAARSRRPEGFLDASKDFMLDRLDDMLEPVARLAGGRAAWRELKENALLASRQPEGGAALLAGLLAEFDARERRDGRPGVELHLAAHSAGAVLFAPLVQLLTGRGTGEHGLDLATVTLWAPACTLELFDQTYRPAIAAGRVGRFALYTLTDRAEREDHCANVYHKSLLYLVAHAFEDRPRLPFTGGTPVLGMERFVGADPGLRNFLTSGPCEWVRAPNDAPPGSLAASSARRHGDFDDDPATVRGTLARVLGRRGGEEVAGLRMERTAAGRRDIRRGLQDAAP